MATSDISHVSKEEENYLRINLLLTEMSQKAVRVLFDKEFHPSRLDASIKDAYGILFDLKMQHVINATQWNMLFPRCGMNMLNLIN